MGEAQVGCVNALDKGRKYMKWKLLNRCKKARIECDELGAKLIVTACGLNSGTQ